MMKRLTNKIALITLVCALLVCAPALFGCGAKGGGTLSSEFVSETGAFRVMADNADANAGVSVSGAVTLKEGDILLVSPDLTSGDLLVKLTDGSGVTAFDEVVSGRVLSTHEVAPGTYDVSVTCNRTGTTGSLVIAAQSAEELEKQNQELEEVLDRLDVEDTDIVSN